MAGSVVEASTTMGYGYLGCTVAVPTVPLSFSVQEPVFGPLPAARSCLQDWVVGCFESWENPPRQGEPTSMPGQPLSAGDSRSPDNEDHGHHINSSDACSIHWASLLSIFRSSTLFGTGFGLSHASSCGVAVSHNLHRSYGGLSGGMDWSKWPTHRIWRL